MNALTLDRIDGDIEQLERMNRVLAAGTRSYGSKFVAELNRSLVQDGGLPVRPIALLHLHASEDIGGAASWNAPSAVWRRAKGRRRQICSHTCFSTDASHAI